MTYTITLSNPGGPLDQRQAETPAEAAATAVRMIQDCGALFTGDRITVDSDRDDDE